jgi:hypothetical protein
MDANLRSFLAEGEKAALRYALGVPRQAPVGLAGSTLSQRAGSSLEFKEHRSYEPGDDLRHIDWNAYARTDQLTVKLFREEVSPHIDIVLDGSKSMALEGTNKAGAALALAAFFATAGSRAGYSHGLYQLADTCQPVGNGNRIPAMWDGITFNHVGDPPPMLPMWRPQGTRVLISDLFWLGEPSSFVRPFAERASSAVVIQLLARVDAEPPEGQSLRMVDSETGELREIHIDVLMAQRYREALLRHQESWNLACRQAGAIFVPLVAERVLKTWKLDALVAAEILRVR